MMFIVPIVKNGHTLKGLKKSKKESEKEKERGKKC
nr:MAG TPA: hypothetical protein [Caudoviricetes sp.]